MVIAQRGWRKRWEKKGAVEVALKQYEAQNKFLLRQSTK
ncbi:MAG: hypothetical protein ACI9TY_000328 [Alphaproteobacteria bacterium]|jgi:hypothetical protein